MKNAEAVAAVGLTTDEVEVVGSRTVAVEVAVEVLMIAAVGMVTAEEEEEDTMIVTVVLVEEVSIAWRDVPTATKEAMMSLSRRGQGKYTNLNTTFVV